MAVFDKPISPQTYAAVRFGTGFPLRGSPTDPEAMLMRLEGRDRMADLWPVVSFDAARNAAWSLRGAMKQSRKKQMGGAEAVKEWRAWIRTSFQDNFVTDMIRSVETDPDYTRRPEPEATLEVLRGLA